MIKFLYGHIRQSKGNKIKQIWVKNDRGGGGEREARMLMYVCGLIVGWGRGSKIGTFMKQKSPESTLLARKKHMRVKTRCEGWHDVRGGYENCVLE